MQTGIIGYFYSLIRKPTIDVYKIVNEHPVTGEPVNLKWCRSAGRYNNGATRYGNKYRLRYLVGYSKTKPYTEEELRNHAERQAADAANETT